MIHNFKRKVRSENGRRLLSNFFSLSSIQMVSYILPMITIPYLVRVLGVEKFGLIAFAQAFVQYFVIFSDYGFGLSATKEIAEHRNAPMKLREIFSSVLVIKLVFVLVSFLLLSLLIFNVEEFNEEWKLYYLTFGIVVGQALFPVWFFQGIEKMHITALVNILPKIFFTLSIFIFIKNPEDYLYVPLINSLGFIISGVLSLWLSFNRYQASFSFPDKKQIIYQLKEGWHIFLGSISSNMTMLNITFLLGILTSPTMVGYYAAVEKIIRPLSSLSRPVINAIFPHLVSLAKTDPQKAVKFSKNVAFSVSTIMFIFGLGLFFFADTLVRFVFGKAFDASSIVLKIMAFIPMIHALYSIYIVPSMIIYEMKTNYSNILLLMLILSVSLSYLFITCFQALGAGIVSVILEILVIILMNIYLNKYQKKSKG